MKRILLTIFGIFPLLLASCLPQDIQIPQSPLLSTLERKSGQIAYIGPDGNIYVSDQGGGQLKALTEDAQIPANQSDPFRIYQTPTWSSDGQKLAFVGLSGEGTQSSNDLYVADLGEDAPTKIYTGANETTFYLYWAPDNSSVSFLSSTPSGQSLILQSVPVAGGDPHVLDTGAPYYWSWAPDGREMVVHAGSAGTASPERMAFLQVDSNVIEDSLDLFPATFQAPAWSPDGSRILLAAKDEAGKDSVIVTDAAGKLQKELGTFTGEVAFAWSRDGEKVAYIASDRLIDQGLLGALHVVDLTTSEEILQDSQVFAFFWAPNSEKLAYFVPFLSSSAPQGGDNGSSTTQSIVLQLNILDVKSGENHELFKFVPTQELLGVLAYFDQYHQSNTIWSPDNNNLVLSFLDGQGQPGIAVVAASGQLEPRLLAPGVLAFWSWQ
jgi:dipeptidyl aminopeptidase/acylaminoacyl peptidase